MPADLPEKILITGGAGFIGSHTVQLLLNQGLEVVVLDNLSSGHLQNLNLKNPKLKFIKNNILDSTALKNAITGCHAVLHLAAIPSVTQSLENPIQSLQVNMQGFLQLLEVIRSQPKPIRLIYASSAAVYGNTDTLPCSDKIQLMSLPLSPYALEKIQNEHYANLYSRLYGIKTLGLRYFNVYGSGQDPSSPYSGVISRFIKTYKQQDETLIYGDGKQSRDFIHVSDIAKANFLAIQSDYCGVINIATGIPESLLNLIQYLEQAGNQAAKYRFTDSRLGDIKNSYAEVDKAEKAISFRFSISLKEGVQKLIQSY